jgi:uncharacterized protein YuzE
MAGIRNLIDKKELNTSLLDKFISAPATTISSVEYDDEFDALYVMLVDCPRETVAYYLDDQIAVLFDPGNKEVIGIQVESFRKVFLKRHHEMQSAWDIKKPRPIDFGDLSKLRRSREPAIALRVAKITEQLIPA